MNTPAPRLTPELLRDIPSLERALEAGADLTRLHYPGEREWRDYGALSNPLFYACIEGHFEAAHALIDAGARLPGERPGDAAGPGAEVLEALIECECEAGERLAVRLIETDSDILLQELGNQLLPIHLACRRGRARIVRAMLAVDPELTERVTEQGDYPMRYIFLSHMDTLDALRALLEAGASHRTYWGTPKTALTRASQLGLTAHMRLLIEAGAADTSAALYHVEEGEYRSAIEMLLDAGAELDHRDAQGETPLHHAITQGRLHVAEALLEAGARTGLRNNAGATLQDAAADNQEAAALLRAHERLRQAQAVTAWDGDPLSMAPSL